MDCAGGNYKPFFDLLNSLKNKKEERKVKTYKLKGTISKKEIKKAVKETIDNG